MAIVAASDGCASPPKTTPAMDSVDPAKEEPSREIGALIDELAGDGSDPLKKLDTVNGAIEQLTCLGTAAFPLLIEHRNDLRYSHFVRALNGPPGRVTGGDATVGVTCVQVIAGQLNAGHAYCGCQNYISDAVSDEKLPEWWKARSTKSLSDLRKESLEWTIAREKKVASNDGIYGECAKDRLKALEADYRALNTRPLK
jgi:hypothetical protein